MGIAVLRSVVFSIRSLDGKIPFKWENELMKRSFEDERTEKEFGRGVASKGDEHFDRLESREFVLSTINPTRKRNKVKSINGQNQRRSVDSSRRFTLLPSTLFLGRLPPLGLGKRRTPEDILHVGDDRHTRLKFDQRQSPGR